MIKFSKLADYAVVILAALSEARTALMTAADLSRETGLPEPTVSKVLKSLVKSSVITSVRGAYGGYALGKATAKITVADIVIAVDGPIALTACVEGSTQICDYSAKCIVNGRWDGVNTAIRSALEDINLADMISAEPRACTP